MRYNSVETFICRFYCVVIFSIHLILYLPGNKCDLNENILIEKEILDSLFKNYDKRVRPGSGRKINISENDPAVVTVNMYIRSISKIDDVSMEYSVQLTFREEWNDERLKFDNRGGKIEYINLQSMENIWQPDLFFANEKQSHFHDMLVRNLLLRVYPNGNILFSVRVSLLLSCPMSLEYYPLDRQRCYIEMISYAYTTKDIIFVWKEMNPIQIIKNLHLPSFTLERTHTSYCTSKTNTGEYSCLRVELLLRREFSYYLLQLYIPSFMLVIVSWVSFWLDKDAVPARVSLGVTTLLTMATQSSGINAKLPPVSYTKAIDIWIGSCLTFIFGALLEFALVNYVARKEVIIRNSTANNKRNANMAINNTKPADKKSLKSFPSTIDSPLYVNDSTSVLINKGAEKYVRNKDDPITEDDCDYRRPLIEFCECGAPLTASEVKAQESEATYYPGDFKTNKPQDLVTPSWKYGGNHSSINEVSFMLPEYNYLVDGKETNRGGSQIKRHLSNSSLKSKRKLSTKDCESLKLQDPSEGTNLDTDRYLRFSSADLNGFVSRKEETSDDHMGQNGSAKMVCGDIGTESEDQTDKGDQFNGKKKKVKCCHSFLKRYKSRAKRIDVLSRIFFPLAFTAFNIVYWLAYFS